MVCDRESDLFIWTPGHGRDDFRVQILQISNKNIGFTFNCTSDPALSREMTDIEKMNHPGYDFLGRWLVEKGNLSEEQMKIIVEALPAYSNSVDGFGVYKNGVGMKILSDVRFIDYRIEGY